MIKFPHSFLDEIKARILTSEIVRRKVALKNNGREHSGLCPFHKEKSPSFTVNDEKGFYHCFGCGKHGNIINFLMETEGLSFPEAVEQLASQAGLAMPKMTEEETKREERVSSLHEIMNLAKNWFTEKLYSGEGREARDYLNKRGLNKNTAEIFALGYSPEGRQGLREFLKTKNVNDAQMLECGLLAKNERGELYDKFRGRLMFPIFDVRGHAIAFGGRILGDGQPKYLNSPDTPLFRKGDVLYNEHLARKTSFKTGRLVITEGYMDVIALYMAGIKEVVAPLGTAVTERQLARMWNLSKEPIMCLDGDAAGQRAMIRAATLATPLLKPGTTLKFASLPSGMDPDDVIKSGGVDKMAEILSKSRQLSEVLWQNEFKNTGATTPESRALLEKNLSVMAEGIKDKTVSNHYRDFFREKMRNIIFGNKKYKNKKDSPERLTNIEEIPDVTAKSRAGAESLLILIILNHPALLVNEELEEEFINIDFSSIKLDKIRLSILEIYHANGEVDKKNLRVHLEKSGFKPDISYLEALGLYQEQENNIDNGGYDNTILYWKYAASLYNLAILKEECQKFANTMTEESEIKAFELMVQIANLEEKIIQMEQAFFDS